MLRIYALTLALCSVCAADPESPPSSLESDLQFAESLLPINDEIAAKAIDVLLDHAQPRPRIPDRKPSHQVLDALRHHARDAVNPLAAASTVLILSFHPAEHDMDRSSLPLLHHWMAPLASADPDERIKGFRDLAQGGRAERMALRFLLEQCVRPPRRTLSMNKACIRVGERLEWAWSWDFPQPGCWSQVDLPSPFATRSAIHGPVVVSLGYMFGSGTGGGRKRRIGSIPHALSFWRFRRAGDGTFDGATGGEESTPGLVTVRWSAQPLAGTPIPITDDIAPDAPWFVYPAPLEVGGVKAVVLPAQATEGATVRGLAMHAQAIPDAVGIAPTENAHPRVRVMIDRQDAARHLIPWHPNDPSQSFWWCVITAAGLPVEICSRPARRVEIIEGRSDEMIEIGDAPLTADITLGDLKPGLYQVLIGYGPVSVERPTADAADVLDASPWWEGTLIAPMVSLTVPATLKADP